MSNKYNYYYSYITIYMLLVLLPTGLLLSPSLIHPDPRGELVSPIAIYVRAFRA